VCGTNRLVGTVPIWSGYAASVAGVEFAVLAEHSGTDLVDEPCA
jgi:hypothetical protein